MLKFDAHVEANADGWFERTLSKTSKKILIYNWVWDYRCLIILQMAFSLQAEILPY